jgi:hypothetical protein
MTSRIDSKVLSNAVPPRNHDFWPRPCTYRAFMRSSYWPMRTGWPNRSRSMHTSTVSRPAIRRSPLACSRSQLMDSGMTDVLERGVSVTRRCLAIFDPAGRPRPVSRDPLRDVAPASPGHKFRVRLPNLLFPLSTKSFGKCRRAGTLFPPSICDGGEPASSSPRSLARGEKREVAGMVPS